MYKNNHLGFGIKTSACAVPPRAIMQRDKAVLRQLLQQELKKRESLKVAEAKVTRLREQLLASEKIASANRTLLKKLQEQVGQQTHDRWHLLPDACKRKKTRAVVLPVPCPSVSLASTIFVSLFVKNPGRQ